MTISRRYVQLLTLLLVPLVRPSLAQQTVPPPAQLAADIIVSGRTSTLRDVPVLGVGTTVPPTFTGDRMGNCEGFSWWVSQHYALRTDYPEARARHLLTVLELAYPHYIELFGREPDGIDQKRLAVCYASSKDALARSLAADGISWNFGGGGITFEGLGSIYCYPSGSLLYHQRFILLHEGAHQIHDLLAGSCRVTPAWYYEGVADLVSSHVLEGDALRLTVSVLDKPTIHNYLDEGLEGLARSGLTPSTIHEAGGAERGTMVLLTAFFATNPFRAAKLQVWRDELHRLHLYDRHKEDSGRILQELFGPWEQIDRDFAAWVAALRSTFHYVEWGWEQDGNTLWSYGFANAGRLSQTNVNLPPGEAVEYSPLRMDYPMAPAPPAIGPVKSGVSEPSVGALLDFSRNPGKGVCGLGLGVIDGARIVPLPTDSLFVDEEGTQPGVRVSVYPLMGLDGQGLRPEDVKQGEVLRQATETEIELGAKGSVTEALAQQSVVRYDGWLKVSEPGRRTLSMASDDGSWLWLDGALVIQNGGMHAIETRTTTVDLTSGLHHLELLYTQGTGEANLQVGFLPDPLPGYVRVLIDLERTLVIDGADLGLQTVSAPLPGEFADAMAAAGHRAGLTVTVRAQTLDADLRAGPCRLVHAELPLSQDARARILSRPIAALARGGYHGVTVFADDARKPEPDLDTPAPANRWRNPGQHRLEALVEATWRLGTHTPPSLAEQMTQLWGATLDPPRQRAAVSAFDAALPDMLDHVAACAASEQDRALAADALNRPQRRP